MGIFLNFKDGQSHLKVVVVFYLSIRSLGGQGRGENQLTISVFHHRSVMITRKSL